jgi:farnesyl-diphosphate farnesyltransferase
MGLFLQKTNIIRDYFEDLVDGRTWWPKEIWSLYASTLGDLAIPSNKQQALDCLNHMVSLAAVLLILYYTQ